jgi:hypothetical protein
MISLRETSNLLKTESGNMGLWDKVGDVIKTAGKEGYKKIIETKDRHQIKMKMLKRFKSGQLKALCRHYSDGPDEYDVDVWDGKKTKRRLSDSDYINHAEMWIKLEDVKDFALQHKIPISDILKEEKDRERKRTPQEIETTSISNQFHQIAGLIQQFEPSRIYKDEFGYHTELQGWLKARFADAVVEYQTGSSRPDIVIDKTAIEVKGPTRNQDLKTIADKCNRYLQYYDNLIVVLFEVDVNERLYQEWLSGIDDRYPEVIIIRK